MTDSRIYGDTEGALGDRDIAGGQTFDIYVPTTLATPNEPLRIVGDAGTLEDRSQGGDDLFRPAANAGLELIGDADLMTDRAVGGDDTVEGARGNRNSLYGDAVTMTGRATGGDDVLESPGAFGIFVSVRSDLYGDAHTLADRARGGDDVLLGARGFQGSISRLFGDGHELRDHAAGGNDTLESAGYRSDEMWGDAYTVGPDATTGADTFVFAPDNGRDTIHDFEPGKDRIDLTAFAGTGLDTFEELSNQIRTQPDGSLVILDLGGIPSTGNSIVVAGVQNLNAGDFILG